MAEPKIPPAPSQIDPNTRALVDAMGEAIRANRAPSPLERAGLTPKQIAQIEEPLRPLRHRKVACKSETGATFTACVVESRRYPDGVVKTMEDYRHPAGTMTYQRDGGLVPDGMQILRLGTGVPAEGTVIPSHELDIFYKQWRWETFWQADLRAYCNGKPLLRHTAVDEASFKTPWKDGHVDSFEAA